MSTMYAPMFVGLDPGQSGGIAVISDTGMLVTARAMPETDRDIMDLLEGIADPARPPRAIIERVRSSPQMGVVSAFSFGGAYRALKMALTATRIPYDEVAPVKWQRAMGVMVATGARAIDAGAATAKKNAHKALAQQLFPDIKVTHALADALLLAEYLRRLETRA